MSEKSQYKIYINSAERHEIKISLLDPGGTEIGSVFGSIDIVQGIKDLFEKHSVKIEEVLFDFFPGPGSFTGLKKGATVANVLNWALGHKKLEDLDQPDYGAEPNITKG